MNITPTLSSRDAKTLLWNNQGSLLLLLKQLPHNHHKMGKLEEKKEMNLIISNKCLKKPDALLNTLRCPRYRVAYLGFRISPLPMVH
jgi:hypothetical protein